MKLILKNVRIAFADGLWEKSSVMGSELKYRVKLLVPKGSKQAETIENSIQSQLKDAFGAKAEAMGKKLRASRNTCVWNDGDDYEWNGAEGNYVLGVSSDIRPKVLNKDKTIVVQEDGVIYSGCYVNAVVGLYVKSKGTPGIFCSLGGIQFAADGEPTGGSTVASDDDFEDISDIGEGTMFD